VFPGLLLACAPVEPSAEEALMASWLQRLDQDGDELLDGSEYRRVAYAAAPLPQVDRDGDGLLGSAELAWLLRHQDPADFDRHERRQLPRRPRRLDPSSAPLPEPAAVRYLLAYLDAELAHAGAGWSGADPELLREALASGIPSSAPSQAVLERYQAAYLAAGLTFPGGLLMEGDPAAPAPP